MNFNVDNQIVYFNDRPYTRHRTTLTAEHIKGLEDLFKQDNRPSNQVRSELAKKLGLTERNVQIWFQNRRTKARSKGEMSPSTLNRKTKRDGRKRMNVDINVDASSITNPSPRSSEFDISFNQNMNMDFNALTSQPLYNNYPTNFDFSYNPQLNMALDTQNMNYFSMPNQQCPVTTDAMILNQISMFNNQLFPFYTNTYDNMDLFQNTLPQDTTSHMNVSYMNL